MKRGAVLLAGPVAAGACILPDGYVPECLDDSKKLTEKKREALPAQDHRKRSRMGNRSCRRRRIDEINILNASLLAMRRAIAAMGATPDLVLVDGWVNRGFDIRSEAVIGGDAKSPSIAAASILAKVTHNRIMAELDGKYPEYGFAKPQGIPYPGTSLRYTNSAHAPSTENRFSLFSKGTAPDSKQSLPKRRRRKADALFRRIIR